MKAPIITLIIIAVLVLLVIAGIAISRRIIRKKFESAFGTLFLNLASHIISLKLDPLPDEENMPKPKFSYLDFVYDKDKDKKRHWRRKNRKAYKFVRTTASDLIDNNEVFEKHGMSKPSGLLPYDLVDEHGNPLPSDARIKLD